MPYKHKVSILWTRPALINEAHGISSIDDCGVYLITRKYIRNDVEWEALLYVGITTRSFYRRISEHFQTNSKWCSAYGKNTLDLELYLFIISITIIKKLLTDIETNIIQNLNSTYPNELINIQQVSTYIILITFWKFIIITIVG